MEDKRAYLTKVFFILFWFIGPSSYLSAMNDTVSEQTTEFEQGATLEKLEKEEEGLWLLLHCEGIEQVFRDRTVQVNAVVPSFNKNGLIGQTKGFKVFGKVKTLRNSSSFIVRELNEKFMKDVCVFSLGYNSQDFFDVQRYFVQLPSGVVMDVVLEGGERLVPYPKAFTVPNGTCLHFLNGVSWYDKKLADEIELPIKTEPESYLPSHFS